MASVPKLSFPVLVLACMAQSAWPSEGGDWQRGVLLAGEILITPEKGDAGRSSSAARSQRERASTYQKGDGNVSPVPDDEGGIMAPRGGAPAEERAFENRMRARAYQQGKDVPSAAIPGGVPGPLDLPVPATAQERAHDLRARARSYTDGGAVDLSHVGSDGIPVVPCRDVDNVTGRIGDDVGSGSIFFVLRNGKPVKVRCK